MMKPLVWNGCYDESWRGLIVDEAFAHPAKAARGLVKRIFAHMENRGWLRKGDSVFDPFGGIFTTGITGASLGFRVVGLELEERFWRLGNANIDLHRRTWEDHG